jgi:hypothetical protein
MGDFPNPERTLQDLPRPRQKDAPASLGWMVLPRRTKKWWWSALSKDRMFWRTASCDRSSLPAAAGRLSSSAALAKTLNSESFSTQPTG